MYVPRRQRMLDQYLKEIGQIDLVTPDEEAELARQIKEGDMQELTKLVQATGR